MTEIASLKLRTIAALRGTYLPKALPRSTEDVEAFSHGSSFAGRVKMLTGGKMDETLMSVFGLYLDLIDEGNSSAAREVRHIFEAMVKLDLGQFEETHLAFVVSLDWSYSVLVPKTREELDYAPRGGW